MATRTLTARSRRRPIIVGHLREVEVAIGAMRDLSLTRLKTQLGAIKIDRDDVWFERYQVGDTADLRIGIGI